MIRLPLPAITFWLFLGLVAGWLLHAFYQATTLPTFASRDDAATAVAQHDSPGAAAPTEVETLVEQGEYDLALKLVGEERAQSERAARKSRDMLLDSLSKLAEKSPEKAQPLLQRFLEEDVYNPMALFLLARTFFNIGQPMRALETLFDLKGFSQTVVAETDINALVDQIESQYARQLREEERFVELMQMYEFLSAHEPDNLIRFYKLAEVQSRLHHYYDALTSLNYVLYDAEMGKFAQALAKEIQQFIALDDEIQVPLKRDGEHFIVNARINGIDGARLVIDTGASVCALRPQAARQFGLTFDSDDLVTVTVAGGILNAPRIEIPTVSVGEAEVTGVQANVIEMAPGFNGDGLLGMNFLGNFKFFIDQKREILYLGSR